VALLLSIDTAGRVTDCRITGSSGNTDLDDATCRLAQRRGRFTIRPAVWLSDAVASPSKKMQRVTLSLTRTPSAIAGFCARNDAAGTCEAPCPGRG